MVDPEGTKRLAWEIMEECGVKVLLYVFAADVIMENGKCKGVVIESKKGRVVSYEVTAGNVGRNADELFRKLQACQFVYEHGDQVCPAKWQPGAETITPSLDLVGQL